MPEKSGIDAAPCAPTLSSPVVGAACCPKAGPAAANVTDRRNARRPKFMPTSRSWLRRFSVAAETSPRPACGTDKCYTVFRYARKGPAAACGNGDRFLGTTCRPGGATDRCGRTPRSRPQPKQALFRKRHFSYSTAAPDVAAGACGRCPEVLTAESYFAIVALVPSCFGLCYRFLATD